MVKVNSQKRKNQLIKKARSPVILSLCNKIKLAQQQDKFFNGAETIISKEIELYPWLTRNMVYGRVIRRKLKEKKELEGLIKETTSIISNTLTMYNSNDSGGRPEGSSNKMIQSTNNFISGGRPEGSTNKMIQSTINLKEMAKDEIAILYAQKRLANNGHLKRGSYKMIHDSVMQKLGIIDKTFVVNVRSIQSRIRRNSLVVSRQNNVSPVADIEPILLQVTLWKQQAGQPITPSEGLALENFLIDQKPLQSRLKVFQMSKKKAPTGILSTKFWQLFMRRHDKALKAAKGVRVAANRTEWVTYQNVESMYNLVYEQMIDSGLARRLLESEQYFVNENGEVVESENDAFGKKIIVEITHPEWILFGDEVGTDISMKDDGHVGGQTFVVHKGTRANIKSSHKDSRFTAIGLTSANGDPVMAIVIFAATELSFVQRMGYDIRAKYNEDGTVSENSGPNKSFPGGPTCTFRGKVIPALITCSPKGGITSDILKEAFKRLDDLGVYERTRTMRPMALFDAHDSRLQVPFLKYINNDAHRWTFCIGLPNGTHKWQVGDSKEQNGSYKMEWTREKMLLVLWRTRMGMETALNKGDILPLFNRVWLKSFARREKIGKL